MTIAVAPTKRKVPRKALAFAAGSPVTMSDYSDGRSTTAADAGTIPKPVTVPVLARTNDFAYQGYWGRCIHDMSGFIPPDGPVPIDWNHGEEDDLGVADQFEVADDGLRCQAKLIPFTAADRASQIIYKGREGFPYQISIVMDLENLVVTEVPDGVVYNVNGIDQVGPFTVFNQWGIEGITITIAGADSDTSLQLFNRGGDVDVTVNSLPEKESVMTEKTPGAAPPTVPATDLPPAAGQFNRDDALKFKTDFGPQGFDWYLEGKTYPEAAKLFAAQQQEKQTALQAGLTKKDEEIAALKKANDELKAKAEFRRGHPTPAKVDPPKDPNAKPGDAGSNDKPNPAHFGRSDALMKFMGNTQSSLDRMEAARVTRP